MKKRTLRQCLYISNPFYIFSAACILYAIYALLDQKEQTEISDWQIALIMMAYTCCLNAVALILIRMKRVWEDSRTLVVLTLLLIMGTPMLMDEFIIKHMEHASTIMHVYFAFSLLNVLGFFILSKIKLPFFFHFLVALSIAIYLYYPSLLLPYVVDANKNNSIMGVYLFPFFTALPSLIAILCFNKVNRAMSNPTAWPLPLNPWLIHIILLFCIPFKTYSLLMVYVPGLKASPDVAWSFQMPVFVTYAILFLKIAEWKQSRFFYKCFYLSLCAGLVLSFWPYQTEYRYQEIQQALKHFYFSSLFYVSILSLGITAYALIKKHPYSRAFFFAFLFLASLFRDTSLTLQDLYQPHFAFVILGVLFILVDLYKQWRSEKAFFILCLAFYFLPKYLTSFDDSLWDITMNLNVFTMALLLIAYYSKDKFSLYLEFASALMLPILLYLNTQLFKDEYGLELQYLLGLISFICVVLYSLGKGHLLLIYSLINTWTVYFFYLVVYFLSKNQVDRVNMNLLLLGLGLVFLSIAVLISFSKANLFKIRTTKRKLKQKVQVLKKYHETTFNREISYFSSFFSTVFFSFILLHIYMFIFDLHP